MNRPEQPSPPQPGAEDALARLEARVNGRVQGVGFRVFVQRAAEAAGCTGYVRNSPEGRAVDVVAEGRRAALERLLEALQRGPRLARVGAVAAHWSAPSGEFSGFDVRD